MHHSIRARFWSACLGNLFEHYDTALFGFLSPFLAPLIFPKQEPITALILTYAMIPLGMLARPVGSFVFGYIGDRYGRAHALSWTLGGMSCVSLCIAFSPTYAQAGLLSPILFCMGRILQNFLSAGETMGGAIFLLENSAQERHDFLSSLYNASTIAGILVASAGVSLVNETAWGWRLLYLAGCITAFFGFLIRRQGDLSVSMSPRYNPWKIYWEHRKALVLIAVTSGFAYANYSMALILINGFVPLVTHFTKTEMANLNTALLIFDFCMLPFFGFLAFRISREKLMIGASCVIALTAIPLFLMLKEASFMAIVSIRILFVLLGVAFFAPFHAWAARLVPQGCRYALISLGYALGSQLLGGPTAALSLWLFKTTQMSSSIGWYWTFLALATTTLLIKQTDERYIAE